MLLVNGLKNVLRQGQPVAQSEEPSGPNAIDQLVGKLARHPEAVFTRAGNSISVRPPGDTGFTVDLYIESDCHTVFFDRGWHEDFKTEQEALNCIAFGLSSSCRLAVTYRGSTPASGLFSHAMAASGLRTASRGC
jgi:hypothetical protein